MCLLFTYWRTCSRMWFLCFVERMSIEWGNYNMDSMWKLQYGFNAELKIIYLGRFNQEIIIKLIHISYRWQLELGHPHQHMESPRKLLKTIVETNTHICLSDLWILSVIYISRFTTFIQSQMKVNQVRSYLF